MSIYDKKGLDTLFVIDDTSPSGLVWKEDRWGGNFKQILKARAGDVAGSKRFKIDGTPLAWHVNYKGGRLAAHRVIWVLKYGYIEPELIIDHIDGNPFNNRLDNLRKTTISMNNRNKKLPKNNSTGIIGVGITRDKHGNINGYSAHRRDITGKDRMRRFSFCKYANEQSALDSAKTFREKVIDELNYDGAGYSDRHGSPAVENLA